MAPLGVSCGYNRVQVFIFRLFVLNALTCKVCHVEKTGDLGDQLGIFFQMPERWLVWI